MERNELTILVKVVQTGSLTKAAEALGMQKAYVSRVLSGLERKLGVRLLERTTRSLSLTEVGRELYGRAVGILAALEEAEQATQRLQTEPRGVLKLTCGVEFGMIAVSRWVNGYLQRYPDMMVEADFSGRVLDLVHEGFDLAIRIGDLPDSSLAARKLGDLHYGLFASPDYLQSAAAPLSTPNDLSQHQHVVFTGGNHRHGWLLERAGEAVAIESSARLYVNNSFAVRDACVAGLGVAQLPQVVAAPSVGQGSLVAVLPDWQLPSVPVHAVFPSTRYLTPKVRAFIDHVVEVFVEK